MRIVLLNVALVAGLVASAAGQAPSEMMCVPTLAPRAEPPQRADSLFEPVVLRPAYQLGRGPRFLFNEAHGGHRADAGYTGFVSVLREDGFVVDVNRDPLSSASLASARVLVMANAGSGRRNDNGHLIPVPSVFTPEEIQAVNEWVTQGGSLWLIVDHLPNAAGSMALARSFGVLLNDGYATDASCSADEFTFSTEDGTLADHSVIRGRDPSERVDSVVTITGTAFRTTGSSAPILVLPPHSKVLMPTEPWEFSPNTPRFAGDGMLQGVTLGHGRGRVAVFGEAAMFSAQVSGAQRRPMGMNMPNATQNQQFLLNVAHWLVGLLPEQ